FGRPTIDSMDDLSSQWVTPGFQPKSPGNASPLLTSPLRLCLRPVPFQRGEFLEEVATGWIAEVRKLPPAPHLCDFGDDASLGCPWRFGIHDRGGVPFAHFLDRRHTIVIDRVLAVEEGVEIEANNVAFRLRLGRQILPQRLREGG